MSPNPGRLCQATNSPAYVLTVLILNIITDVYLLSIPLPVSALGKVSCQEMRIIFADNQQLLWGVDTTLKRRLTLMLLFSGAVFIILAGTIRAITILTVSSFIIHNTTTTFPL